MDKEIWKTIPDYQWYKVSNYGRVKSIDREVPHRRHGKLRRKGVILKPFKTGQGYLSVGIINENGWKSIYISKLMAMAFLNHKPNGHEIVVDHIDNNKLNNNLNNLQLISNRENTSKGKLLKPKSSKYTGVYFHKRAKKWQAYISINGEINYLGLFEKEEEASEAYENKLKDITKLLGDARIDDIEKFMNAI